MSPFNLSTCARANILALQPYRCARDDYKDDGTNILLDANENAYGPGLALNKDGKLDGKKLDYEDVVDIDLDSLNRYPDPHQNTLKQLLCNLRNTTPSNPSPLTPSNLFIGVGSDEAIDALLRCFCIPGRDKILVCPPTYGMYSVSAQVNDISLVKIPLLQPSFGIDVPAITSTLSSDSSIKLVYLCSPGNPTAALLASEDIEALLNHPTWNGIIVLDEAYIDFSGPNASKAEWVTKYPNLVVMQTFSKGFGLAGIRVGAAFTSAPIARLLNSLKAPYNISNLSSQVAEAALSDKNLEFMRGNIDLILKQRDRLIAEMGKIPGVGDFKGGMDANFVLVEMLDAPREKGGRPCNETALWVYERLAEEKGVVVRFRGKEVGCEGCLRVTVGTEREVGVFLERLETVLKEWFGKKNGVDLGEEERREREANDVVD